MGPDNKDTFDLLFRIYGEGQVPPSEEEPPVEVGGEVYPANKLGILVPWIVLSAAIIAGAIIAMRRRSPQN